MRIAIAACGLLMAAVAAPSWSEETTLQRDTAVDGDLREGEKAVYLLELAAGQFVYGEVLQHDVDVRVTLFDPAGNVADRFDSSSRGVEPVQLETRTSGTYRVELASAAEESGAYTLRIDKIEPLRTDPERRLDQLLSQFAGDDVPGAVVAVVRDGRVVHAQAVGMANLTHGVPFERDTLSNVGSVSKQFTAFAVTQLAALGKLSLDDDVRQYFPELPDLGEVVTIRHLLNHTSGYREFLNLLGMSGRGIGEGDYIDRDELLDILKRQPALQEHPGTVFSYNNTAYGLAALLVERVTDVAFPRWMADNVFAPIGMEHTRVRSHLGEIIPNSADGYVYAEQSPFRQAADLGGGGGAAMGAGAIYSTVDDLARWMGNLQSARVGGAGVIGEMTRPQIETPGEDSYYGLGLSIGRHRGLTLWSHGGADVAHRAMILFYPELNAGVISLSNNGAFSGDIARKAAEAFFAEQMDFEAAPDPATLASGTAGAVAGVDPAVFDPHLGKYELDGYPGVVISVTRDEQQVFVQSPGQDPLPVTPLSALALAVPPDQRIEFRVGDDGRAEGLTLIAANELTARRLADWSPALADLEVYVGRYFSNELETFYTVVMGEEGLLIRHRRLDDIALTPKVLDSFNATFPVSEVAFTRDAEGAVTGMNVSNVRTRNIRFERER